MKRLSVVLLAALLLIGSGARAEDLTLEQIEIWREEACSAAKTSDLQEECQEQFIALLTIRDNMRNCREEREENAKLGNNYRVHLYQKYFSMAREDYDSLLEEMKQLYPRMPSKKHKRPSA